MATATANNIHHGTLVASTVDTVTLTNAGRAVKVQNRSASGDIYFTVGTVTKPPATPAAATDDNYIALAAGTSVTVSVAAIAGQPIIVKLVSTGTPSYTVNGV